MYRKTILLVGLCVLLLLAFRSNAQRGKIFIPKTSISPRSAGGILGKGPQTVRIEPPSRVTASPQVRSVVAYSKSRNGAAMPGLKGNKSYHNDGRGNSEIIAEMNFSGMPAQYKTYRVSSAGTPGFSNERVIINTTTGSAFHTTDHYASFRKVIY